MSFASSLNALYIEIDLIAQVYTGWGLVEIKDMSPRQRRFWVAVIKWRKESGG